ncbi:TadE family type IV pilus minor pilin [Amycolatopsis sp. NPDC059027]|uniref:TadE family type IV pilus minor pilin n=1 Tax=Amycolatopsis sp. NPDC059027 TaxID=3346709 RepID=UPI00366DFD73
MDVGIRRAGDRGYVTVESAIGLGGLTIVLACLLAGIGTVSGQLRCTDAAREAARLLARGQPAEAESAVHAIAPSGARLDVRRAGDGITVEVGAEALGGLLPGVHLSATAYAMAEPGTEAGHAGR